MIVTELLPLMDVEPYATLKGSRAVGTVPVVRLDALLAPMLARAFAALVAPVPPLAMGTGVAMPA